jgi:predicted aspartyl protease
MPTLRLVATPTRRPIIELRINGRMYHFLIDTGATHTVLDTSLLPILNEQQQQTRRTIKCHGVGSSVHTERITVCFRFVGVSIDKVMFHQAAREHFDHTHGLIGQDILQQFKSVTFDNVNHVVRFEV